VIRRTFRLALWLGVLAGIALAINKVLASRQEATLGANRAPEPWPRLTSDPSVPAAPVERAVPDPVAPAPAAAKVWVEPKGDVCPTSHPVKAKLASKIFHLPGMANYDRTKPDRCYADAAGAEADGLRPAKR
jgi:hypothetical protein